jgi:hypothetical protein
MIIVIGAHALNLNLQFFIKFFLPSKIAMQIKINIPPKYIPLYGTYKLTW